VNNTCTSKPDPGAARSIAGALDELAQAQARPAMTATAIQRSQSRNEKFMPLSLAAASMMHQPEFPL
jgi:hypothetical protein